jgi:hypothetical protein
MRVFWQATQQSFSNSHLRARSRKSLIQESADSDSRWTRDENFWRHT